jgi:hypothetical protein
MERAGALPTSMVVEGHVEPLADALAAWEAAAAPQIWVPADERHDAAPEVSLFVDGGVYLATLVPIVATLEAAGYGRPLIHAWHTAMQRPVVLPLRVAATVPDDAHLIVVRSDGFLVQPWDPERMDSGDVVTRLESDPLLRLHRLVREQRQSGRLDPERRIAVRVDDLSTDLGTLAHVLLALAWERDLEAIETDAQLLAAPLLRDAGSVRELAGHGITVAPG